MRLSPTIQRSERLLNCAIWVGEHIGPADPWNSLAHLLRSRANSREDLATMLKNGPLMARGLTARFITLRGYPESSMRSPWSRCASSDLTQTAALRCRIAATDLA